MRTEFPGKSVGEGSKPGGPAGDARPVSAAAQVSTPPRCTSISRPPVPPQGVSRSEPPPWPELPRPPENNDGGIDAKSAPLSISAEGKQLVVGGPDGFALGSGIVHSSISAEGKQLVEGGPDGFVLGSGTLHSSIPAGGKQLVENVACAQDNTYVSPAQGMQPALFGAEQADTQQGQVQEVGMRLVDILVNSLPRPPESRKQAGRRHKNQHDDADVLPEQIKDVFSEFDEEMRLWVVSQVSDRAPQWLPIVAEWLTIPLGKAPGEG
jgi:hypothetical protein